MHFGLIAANENKKYENQDTKYFEMTSYRVLHERSNKTVSFAEHLKFQGE